MSEHPLPTKYNAGIFSKSDILFANSKLAMSYFTRELSRRLQGSKVAVFSVCPGVVVTKLFRSMSGLRRLILSLILLAIGQTPDNVRFFMIMKYLF